MIKNVDTSVTTLNFFLTCSSGALYNNKVDTLLTSWVYQLQLSGSRVPIQHSHIELQVTLILK